jgi:hypothetical protein
MKKLIIELTPRQHARIHELSDKVSRPVKRLIEGLLTGRPQLSEQEKKETLKALKYKPTDENSNN